MRWLAPAAFAAFVLLAGPIVVHLLARRSARRLIFPAAHFVRATQAAAVRLAKPSDMGLLILRLAIVATAVLAAARPLILTPWRLAQWNARVARAIVVDTSPSVTDDAAASRLADEQIPSAFTVRRFDARRLADGIERAVSWLRTSPPARREIVVVSDFQRGAMDHGTLAAIPRDVGIRFIRVGAPVLSRQMLSPPVAGWRGGAWQASTTVNEAGTRAVWTRRSDAEVPRWITLKASPADSGAADRALHAAIALGLPPGDDSHRILITFAGADPLTPPARPASSPWIGAAALALRDSDILRGVPPPVVMEQEGAMVVEAPVSAAALEAPAIVRAAVLAVRPAAIVDGEAEVATVPDADLAAWRREPTPVTGPADPAADARDQSDSDARWLWALAVALLMIEGRVRRRRGPAAEREVHAHAA